MRTGRIIEDHPNDAYLGLAVDHALLMLGGDGVTLRLWRNPPSVVIGRGQSPPLEVDGEYCRRNGISVCRRISGGGAVYQDLGNLNISLVYPRSALAKPHGVKEATRQLPGILYESLLRRGVNGLTMDDLNAIHKDGLKVSGAASYIGRDSVLSHSTLLLSVNVENLERSLLHPTGVRRPSRYSPTANLQLDVEAWKPVICGLVEERFDARLDRGELTGEEVRLAGRLREALYANANWVAEGAMPVNWRPKKGIV